MIDQRVEMHLAVNSILLKKYSEYTWHDIHITCRIVRPTGSIDHVGQDSACFTNCLPGSPDPCPVSTSCRSRQHGPEPREEPNRHSRWSHGTGFRNYCPASHPLSRVPLPQPLHLLATGYPVAKFSGTVIMPHDHWFCSVPSASIPGKHHSNSLGWVLLLSCA